MTDYWKQREVTERLVRRRAERKRIADTRAWAKTEAYAQYQANADDIRRLYSQRNVFRTNVSGLTQ